MRKKLAIGGTLLAAAVIAVVGYLWWVGGQALTSNQNLSEQAAKILVSQTDGDDDGLPDWEEALWQTDPSKADSDGDGTGDGEEVKAGRNPALAAEAGATAGLSANAMAEPSDKLPDPLARATLLARDALGETSGLPVTAPAEQVAAPVKGDWSALSVIEVETAATPRVYGEQLAAALGPFLRSHRENLLGVLLRYIDNLAPADLTILQTAVAGMNESLARLSALAVPRSQLVNHRALLDHLAKLVELTQAMSEVRREPVVALQSGQVYAREYPLTLKALLDLNQYLIDHRVRLSASTTPLMIDL